MPSRRSPDRSFLLYDGLPDEVPDAADAIALVQKQLSGHPEIQGVVLIGGYDVVPSQTVKSSERRDVSPIAVRPRRPRRLHRLERRGLW